MFSKVLIANRGAIAVRIIRTLDNMGVGSVAIYHEADADSLHTMQASESFNLGGGSLSETYLNQDAIIGIAIRTGAEAIHPGYGFLSENTEFAKRCEAEGIAFIGPTAKHMAQFGLKHTARELALAAGLPLLPGSDLLSDLDAALDTAQSIGYPVMLKSTAGGGGIGMQLCDSPATLSSAFDSVKRLSGSNFSNDGVFIEKYLASARHIEVQVFGDGHGEAITLGERDCSAQRRNQKVVEETPAPNISEKTREQLHRMAHALMVSVNYRNAGTVEFIYDQISEKFYFLEVNTRLQVEHGVTEAVYGVDIVEWMLKLAASQGAEFTLPTIAANPRGHAIQVRLYAENPAKQFQPCAGLLSQVDFPTPYSDAKSLLRIDTWIESGVHITPLFDPMLAKVICWEPTRKKAIESLDRALQSSVLYGIETNREYTRTILQSSEFRAGATTTRSLSSLEFTPTTVEVLAPGTLTTIQDLPGRRGYWDVGVPPSGPFDGLSLQLANRALCNDSTAAALEITLNGPSLRFNTKATAIVTGAPFDLTLDGEAIKQWKIITVEAGQILSIGAATGEGARCYLAVAGGWQCPEYLGSQSTFTLGQFGGHCGRALQVGDALHLASSPLSFNTSSLPSPLVPSFEATWELRVIYGPHGAPDFFTEKDIDVFFAQDWEVHYNSSRTGVRLIGPKPEWARTDGGEAGLHPSNIHDNAYAIGSIDFTGDMPVILGPDGPSLGGFVCPATVITADLWKLGQLKAGHKIRFVPVSIATAVALERAQIDSLEALIEKPENVESERADSPIIHSLDASEFGVAVCYRPSGDHYLLVEYGEQVLDINLRFRAHALMLALQKRERTGIWELTPGIRSLQIHYNSQVISIDELIDLLVRVESELNNAENHVVENRIVHLPLSWDDEVCKLAVQKYDQSVRKDAPWAPDNLEFIRRINGLDSIDDVKDIVFSASYLVMGLGDVYLGAPVATPIDPRHRLVTTKYNPARTWTAENSVGIGGSYLCVYGMEGPGGYQFVGRTLQMWNRHKETREFSKPWLLRFFDQIKFYEVSHDELTTIRQNFTKGHYSEENSPVRIEKSTFSLEEYNRLLEEQKDDILQFSDMRQQAFNQELQQWIDNGQLNFEMEAVAAPEAHTDAIPDGHVAVYGDVAGNVWQLLVDENDTVEQGQTLVIIESMKMELAITAPCAGVVASVVVSSGTAVAAGSLLITLKT